MPTAFIHPRASELPLTQIRRHAALVRALLDELERVTVTSNPETDSSLFIVVNDQLADEIGRLGRRLLEHAGVLRAADPKDVERATGR